MTVPVHRKSVPTSLYGIRPGRPFVLFLLFFLLPACNKHESPLEAIRKQGTLIVLTRNAPTTYYEGRHGLEGLEYDMATAFAKHLGVEPKFKVMDTVADILAGLTRGEGDIAAAGLTRTPGRELAYLAGPTYQIVEQQVACHRKGKRPKSIAGLSEVNLTVAAESSYLERLQYLQKEYPELTWQVTKTLTTEQLIEQVWERKLDCTVADSNIMAINRRYFPELVVSFHLTEPEPLAWMMQPKAEELKKEVDEWFRLFKESGRLELLLEQYYGFIEIFDYVNTRAYVRRITKVLPRYQLLFQQAAKENALNWTLLAAQSYQESHWNPNAKSPTGVKGMMMLTKPTAREVGIKNRLDPEQSILGGAGYLTRLRDRLPEEIKEPDRTWIALAAYNVGMGHLYDARTLSRRLEKNPDVWRDLSEVLPLLSQKQYYRTLKHGYARGREPVRYVNRIRDYLDILERSVP